MILYIQIPTKKKREGCVLRSSTWQKGVAFAVCPASGCIGNPVHAYTFAHMPSVIPHERYRSGTTSVHARNCGVADRAGVTPHNLYAVVLHVHWLQTRVIFKRQFARERGCQVVQELAFFVLLGTWCKAGACWGGAYQARPAVYNHVASIPPSLEAFTKVRFGECVQIENGQEAVSRAARLYTKMVDATYDMLCGPRPPLGCAVIADCSRTSWLSLFSVGVVALTPPLPTTQATCTLRVSNQFLFVL